ncbi:unnamed protein product [Microthlaspi erraticum]|uniref:Non-specific lipid-transfer protein n=1 Tax=Microthlaspi erraticum TaxID=1685480 RepID=A0A6D2K5Q4_9BRAS|nr:unnamed protein product [Microthlaspi erraticum]
MAGAMKLACLVLACMIVAGPITANALTCGVVFSTLSPCRFYMSNGGPLPPACCAGIRKLRAMARTTTDRRQACTCITQAVKAFNSKGSRAAALPSKCGINLPYKFSSATNCKNVA